MDRLTSDTELRDTLINSALKTNADNPQDFSANGYDTIVKILEMYQNDNISDIEIFFLAERLDRSFLVERLDRGFNFKPTSEEIEKRVKGILALHGRYLNELSPDSISRICIGLPHVIAHTIWNSAEAAKSVIEGKFGYMGQVSELEARMWEVICGPMLNRIDMPKNKFERIALSLDKLKAEIENRRIGVEKRRRRYSR